MISELSRKIDADPENNQLEKISKNPKGTVLCLGLKEVRIESKEQADPKQLFESFLFTVDAGERPNAGENTQRESH